MFSIPSLKKQLYSKVSDINVLTDNTKINKILEDSIVEITGAEFSSIWIYDFPSLCRNRDNEKKEISIDEKSGLLYECYAKKQAGIYNYLSSEKGYVPSVDNPDNIKIKSKIMVPIIDNDTFIGIATAYSSIKNIHKFTNDDLKIFQAITPFIIESIYKMKQNTNNLSVSNNIITTNTDENLENFEKSILDVKAPTEILEYVSNIVHDIRTPANGLLGFLEILEEEVGDNRLQEYVKHAKNSALLINELTTTMLDSISAKREPFGKEVKHINTIDFFSEIAEMFSANMFKKNINYNIFIDPLLPKEIELNSMKIKRVIMNLISNASKFTPENGSIEFSVRYKQKEKKLHIFVKDTGIGIEKDKQEEIFKAFKQAENDTKSFYGGTGLGLSICAAYVKDIEGKLLVESKINQGSTFYFELPMEIKDYANKFKAIKNNNINIAILMQTNNSFVANHISRYLVKVGVSINNIHLITEFDEISDAYTHLIVFENKLSENIFSKANQNKTKLLIVEENFLSLNEESLKGGTLISQYSNFGYSLYSFIDEKNIPKVLIVEDDEISCILIKKILENEYCKIDIANNGKDGLELLTSALDNSKPYDIVYTDHDMPLLSGTDMLIKYKEIEQSSSSLKKTVSVSVSGDVRKISNFNYDYFATKPFKKKEIVSLFLKSIS